MKMKRLMASALVLALSVTALVGCGGKKEEVKQPAGDQKQEVKMPAKLVLGLVASQEADKLAANAKPMTDFLSKELGIPVESFVTPTYAVAIEGMGSGKVDIGLIPAFSYVIAHQRYGVEAVLKSVRGGSTTYKSQILVRKDSGITKLEDLKGKKFAFTDPTSTAGYLWPAAHLKDKGIDIEPGKFFSDVVMLKAHDKVAQAVFNKDVAGGAMFADSRDRLKATIPTIMEDTVVLELIPRDIPNDTISVRKDLPAELKTKIVNAFKKFATDEQGKKTIKTIYTWDGVAEATDADYNVVRDVAKALGIDLKAAEIK